MSATSPRTPSLEVLADTLWSERRVVEYLLFKLVTAKLLLAADERRFVASAFDEVERVLDALKHAEGQRLLALAAAAGELGVSEEDLTLSDLASNTPEPMRSVFREHRDAFAALTDEIEETASANRQLASAALNHVRRTLEAITGPALGATTYTATGTIGGGTAVPTRVDEVL